MDDDPFCAGQNSYVQMAFKILNFTLSGLDIDPKNISAFPATKATTTIEKTVSAKYYFIWNSLGKARYALKADDIVSPTGTSAS